MITRAKFEKSIDDAFGDHVSAAFNVLIQGISGASSETKDVAVRGFTKSMHIAIEARELAMANAPEAVAKK